MKHLTQKMGTNEVDREVLSLFPSLDFNRPNVHGQKKKRMKNYLIVLKKAAEMGCVTKYMLTKVKASPRMGGQVAQDTLKELEGLGLLSAKQATSKRGTRRIDRILTAKGIIACMAMPKFQKADQLEEILGRQFYKGSKLASLLKVFNNGFVRRKNIDISISPAVVIVKELAVHGFNFELKSEDSIAQNLRTIEESGFIESMKMNPFEFWTLLVPFLDEKDAQLLLNLMYKISEKSLKEERLDFETRSAISRFSKTIQDFFLLLTSPEFVTWLRIHIRKDKTVAFEELEEAVDRIKLESEVKFTDDLDRFEWAIRAMREWISKHLIGHL